MRLRETILSVGADPELVSLRHAVLLSVSRSRICRVPQRERHAGNNLHKNEKETLLSESAMDARNSRSKHYYICDLTIPQRLRPLPTTLQDRLEEHCSRPR
jgi:hypothetical protein